MSINLPIWSLLYYNSYAIKHESGEFWWWKSGLYQLKLPYITIINSGKENIKITAIWRNWRVSKAFRNCRVFWPLKKGNHTVWGPPSYIFSPETNSQPEHHGGRGELISRFASSTHVWFPLFKIASLKFQSL